eukprot:gene29963-18030_t
MDKGIHKGDLGWGSPNFHKMGRFKIALIKQFSERDVTMLISDISFKTAVSNFLELDVTMIISDIDTTWLRDPIPYFQRYPEADVLTSTDELRETVPDESLEDNRKSGASFNIGIMMFRNTSMELVDEWIKSLDDPKMWDQTAFNQIARRTKNLWKGFDGKLNIGILPASIFCSGHMFFVQYKELGLEPYVAHATFQYSGTPGKRNRFREFMLWDDPPEYYDSPHGFISMSIDIPQNLWDAVKKEVKGAMTPDKIIDHYNLVHHQMGLLRTALALTTLTGRVIIMPPIWCQLDKYWAPLHNGNIPGSMFIKPFICPMDHVLDIEAGWHRKFDENHFGPHIEWREYSFLQNERMTPAVNNSRVELEVCPAGEADCEGSIVKDNKLRVPDNMDAQKLKEMLTSKVPPSTKILHLPSKTLDKFRLIHNTMPEILHLPSKTLDKFRLMHETMPKKEKAQFIVRLNHQVSVDCCLQKNPGWVWYDFFYDIDPHTDRFGRQYTGVNKVFYAGDSKETVEVVKPARRMSAARKLTAASLEDASASFEGAEFVSVEGRRLQGEEWSYEAREGEVTLGGLSYPDAMLSAP